MEDETRAAGCTSSRSPGPNWIVLGAVAVVFLVAQLPATHATAWHFFDDAVRLLTGGGTGGEGDGLHLYRDHPELQFGPLSIVLAAPFTTLGENGGALAAMITATFAGLVAFHFLLRATQQLGARPNHLVCTVAGIVFVAVWSDVAVRTAHIDDAIALAITAAAVWATTARRGFTAAVLLGAAAAAKPWAIAFAPIALAAGEDRRLLRLLVVAAVPALTWAPFVLAEPSTLDVRDFTIAVDPTSPLRAMGIDAATTPSWARPTQLLGGFALAALVTWRGRWHAAVLAAVAWRLLLEPGAHRYYTAGAVLGALLVEVVARPRTLPWRTAALAVVLEVTALPNAPAVAARTVRLAAVLAALVGALTASQAVPSRRSRQRGLMISRTASTTSACSSPDHERSFALARRPLRRPPPSEG